MFFFSLMVLEVLNPFDGVTCTSRSCECLVTSQRLDIISRDFSYHATSSNLPSFYLLPQERERKRYCQPEVKLERLRGLGSIPRLLYLRSVHYLARIIRWRISHSKSRSYYGRSFYRLSKFLTRNRESGEQKTRELA